MYYVYMGLLIVALILWTIIALKPDSGGDESKKRQ